MEEGATTRAAAAALGVLLTPAQLPLGAAC